MSTALAAKDDRLFDPFLLPQYHALNAAIERFTDAAVSQDPAIFKVRGRDLRYVVERRIFFVLFADQLWHRRFVAIETGREPGAVEDLHLLGRLVAPFMWDGLPPPDLSAGSLGRRVLRAVQRFVGRAEVEQADIGGRRADVLFLVTQSKFVTYLSPIAEALGRPYAFLTFDHFELKAWLKARRLPRAHIQVTPASRAQGSASARVAGLQYKAGPFDDLPIEFNSVRRALKLLRPCCLVVPEGNSPIYELAHQAARSLGIRTVCIQQGWAPVVHTGFRNMSYSEMCVWGPGFREILEPHNPQQSFKVTGNHMIDPASQGEVENRRALAFFMQNGAHMMTEAAWTGMLDLVSWAAQQLPSFEIRVREHPGVGGAFKPAELARFAGPINVRLMPPAQYSLAEVLDGCRVAVAMNSTTILEGIAMGVIPLILDVNGYGRYNPDVVSEGAAVEVQTYEEARRVLTMLYADDASASAFQVNLARASKRFFAAGQRAARDAIVEAILN